MVARMKTIEVTSIPLEVIFLHRLARIGQASSYSPNKFYVSFDIDAVQVAKWPEFTDAVRVSLMYSPNKRGQRYDFNVPRL